MKSVRLMKTLQTAPRVSAALLIGTMGLTMTAMAQDAKAPKPTVKDGYNIRQSVDLGGRIANYSGSSPVYDTMVNLQSGPRVLNQTLDMRAVDGSKHWLFDSLFTGSAGYGGDPNNFSTLRMSKGRIYDFSGLFRRDRQYFDYNLFGNPLVPLTSYGTYTFPQVNHAEHLFNTVRRMTDTDLSLFPLSKVTVRAGYSSNIMQGPTYSSIHQGSNALLFQGWRNSTDTWTGAVDWKPIKQTVLTFEEHVNHYKGNTYWQLAGFNAQLANGTPISLGFDAAPAANCFRNTTTNPPIASPTCNGYLQDVRISPTRTLFPTEEFRFETSALKNFQTNGRFSYTGASMNLPSYFEYFNGLESRTHARTETFTGFAKAQRVNVSADYGFAWTISDKLTLTEQFDFQNFRLPSVSSLTEVLQTGTSMATAPSAPADPETSVANNFLGQKTITDTVGAEYQVTSRASVSVAYRYRDRTLGFVQSLPTDELEDGRNYQYSDHEQAVILGTALRPTADWKVNGSVEIGTANDVYVPVTPRNFQRYQARTSWRAKEWATLSGAFRDTERKNDETNVNYRAHDRALSAGVSLAPSEHYTLELSYGYLDVFSEVQNCFGDPSGLQPADATPLPAGTVCGNLPSGTTLGWYGNSHYDAPTQYGSIGVTWSPVTKIHSGVGYRANGIDGHYEMLNPRNVPGSMQSFFQTPYANLAYTVAPGWSFRGDWNYYSYGEGSPIGPTLPRSFRGNLYTLGMHYDF